MSPEGLVQNHCRQIRGSGVFIGAAGGFAPSIEAPPATSEPPPTTTVDAALLPAFVGRHNTTVTVHAGDTATLSCHVVRLGDKTVRGATHSW
ncbi:hypothetical protein E2C01_076702 [Portunus trituberculatus]|uniref:Ig-like domain-containing protein n=1 Tax=Portunus trituberculatus TaxID=210409 RepID=A0A5B7IJM7_PORTR|nr:hypothetical protein [Portunus trituberculatus]